MGMRWDTGPGVLLLDTVAARPAAGQALTVDRARWVTAIGVCELSGTGPASVQLWTGPPVDGQLIAELTILAGATLTWTTGLPGLPAPAGVSLLVAAGDVSVSLTTAERTPS